MEVSGTGPILNDETCNEYEMDIEQRIATRTYNHAYTKVYRVHNSSSLPASFKLLIHS